MTTATSTRDQSRERLYAAEQQVRRILDTADAASAAHGPSARRMQIHGSTIVLPIERRFADLDSIQRYVDSVLALNWVQALNPWPDITVTVRERRGVTRAHYQRYGKQGCEIAIPVKPSHSRTKRWAMREIVVLHEIAHHLTNDEIPGHGPRFAGCFLELVEGIIGHEVALVLRMVFHENRVDVA